jgi:hypothetical protein
MQKTSAADFMIDEFVVFYDIKMNLLEQSVQRLLDVHLGNYVPEEGEIVKLWEPEELDSVSKRIAQYKIKNLRIQNYNDEDEEEDEEDEEEEDEQR